MRKVHTMSPLFKVFTIVTISYFLCYVVLMRRNTPAFDINGEISYRSSFIFSSVVRISKNFTFFGPKESILNIVYAPLDEVYYFMYDHFSCDE
jgi:hypothetical protein